MVAIVNTFTYTGTVQEVTIPAGTTSIDMYLWGGAGGGGGGWGKRARRRVCEHQP